MWNWQPSGIYAREIFLNKHIKPKNSNSVYRVKCSRKSGIILNSRPKSQKVTFPLRFFSRLLSGFAVPMGKQIR